MFLVVPMMQDLIPSTAQAILKKKKADEESNKTLTNSESNSDKKENNDETRKTSNTKKKIAIKNPFLALSALEAIGFVPLILKLLSCINKNESLEREKRNLNNKLSSSQQEEKTLRNENAESIKALKPPNNRVEDHKSLEPLQSRYASLETENRELNAKNMNSENRISTLSLDNQNLQTRIQCLETEKSNFYDQLRQNNVPKEQLEQSKEHNEILELLDENSKHQIEILIAQNKEKDNLNKNLTEKNSSQSQKILSLNSKIICLESAVKEKENQKIKIKNENAYLSFEQKEKIQSLEKKNNDLKSRIQQLNNQINNLNLRNRYSVTSENFYSRVPSEDTGKIYIEEKNASYSLFFFDNRDGAIHVLNDEFNRGRFVRGSKFNAGMDVLARMDDFRFSENFLIEVSNNVINMQRKYLNEMLGLFAYVAYLIQSIGRNPSFQLQLQTCLERIVGMIMDFRRSKNGERSIVENGITEFRELERQNGGITVSPTERMLEILSEAKQAYEEFGRKHINRGQEDDILEHLFSALRLINGFIN